MSLSTVKSYSREAKSLRNQILRHRLICCLKSCRGSFFEYPNFSSFLEGWKMASNRMISVDSNAFVYEYKMKGFLSGWGSTQMCLFYEGWSVKQPMQFFFNILFISSVRHCAKTYLTKRLSVLNSSDPHSTSISSTTKFRCCSFFAVYWQCKSPDLCVFIQHFTAWIFPVEQVSTSFFSLDYTKRKMGEARCFNLL